jgi:hypothetical protein
MVLNIQYHFLYKRLTTAFLLCIINIDFFNKELPYEF